MFVLRITLSGKLDKRYKNLGGKKSLPWADIIALFLKLLPAICPALMVRRMVTRNPDHYADMFEQVLKNEGISTNADRKLIALSAVDVIGTLSSRDIDDLR